MAKVITLRTRLEGAEKVKSGLKGIDSRLLSLGKAAAGAAAGFFGANMILSGLKAAVNEAAEAELSQRKLETALGRSSRALIDHANALQKVTMFEDDAIVEAEALLAMFIKDEDQLKKATTATLDLAAAKGMDLASAADLVAKSIGTDTNALSRYGVEVKGAVGSTERLESATNNIAKLFGGQAKAQAETMAGSITQMKNAVGNAAEEIGNLLSPAIIGVANAVKTMAQGIADMIGWRKQFEEMAKSAKLLTPAEFALIGLKDSIEKLTRQELKERLFALGVGVEEFADKIKPGIKIVKESNETVAIQQQMVALLLAQFKKMPDEVDDTTKAYLEFVDLQIEKFAADKQELENIEKFKKEFPELAQSLGMFNEQLEEEARLSKLVKKSEEEKAAVLAEFHQRYVDSIQGQFALEKEEIDKSVERFREAGVAEVEIEKWKANALKNLNAEILSSKLDSVGGLVGAIGELNSASKGSALVTKRLAQAEAVMNTWSAANKALAAGVPPWNFIQMAAVITAGLANVVKIENTKFAKGGDFVTSGKQMIMVGDNPGGRERVQVTPLSSPNINGPKSSSLTLQFNGPITNDRYVRDFIIPEIKKATRLNLA